MPKAERVLHITASIVTILTAVIALVSWGWVIDNDPEIMNSQSFGAWIKEVLFNVSGSLRVVIAFTFQIFSSHYLSRYFSSEKTKDHTWLQMLTVVIMGFLSFVSLSLLQLEAILGKCIMAIIMVLIAAFIFGSKSEGNDPTPSWVFLGSLVMMLILSVI